MFLGEMSCRRYDNKKCKEQKEHHSYKIGTWNVRTLNQGGKLENLKTESMYIASKYFRTCATVLIQYSSSAVQCHGNESCIVPLY